MLHHIYLVLVILPLLLVAQNSTLLRPKRQELCAYMHETRTCYLNYAALYGLLPQKHGARQLLPRYDLYDSLIKITELDKICTNFDILASCLGSYGPQCTSPSVFIQLAAGPNDARDYLLDFYFFQHVCGRGKQAFSANQECLSQAFRAASLTTRIVQCGGSSHRSDPLVACDRGIAAVGCVRDQLLQQCGLDSGQAVCSAATNMARGLNEVDVTCLQQMEYVCSSSHSLTAPLTVMLVSLLLEKLA